MTVVFSRRPPVSLCPHENDKSTVFETLNSGDRWREATFLVPENGVYVCERKAKTEGKKTCGRGLMEHRVTEINAPLIRTYDISFKTHVQFMKD